MLFRKYKIAVCCKFSGYLFQLALGLCTGVTCENEGQCIETTDSQGTDIFLCVCVQGWTGDHCQTQGEPSNNINRLSLTILSSLMVEIFFALVLSREWWFIGLFRWGVILTVASPLLVVKGSFRFFGFLEIYLIRLLSVVPLWSYHWAMPFFLVPWPSWGTWAGWGACSVTCGLGWRLRTRKCLDGQTGGITDPLRCHGRDTDVDECDLQECPRKSGKFVRHSKLLIFLQRLPVGMTTIINEHYIIFSYTSRFCYNM